MRFLLCEIGGDYARIPTRYSMPAPAKPTTGNTNLEKAIADFKPNQIRAILAVAQDRKLDITYLTETVGLDSNDKDDAATINQILAAYNLDVAEAGGSTAEPGSEFFKPTGTSTEELKTLLNSDISPKDLLQNFTDQQIKDLGFNNRNDFEEWVLETVTKGDTNKIKILCENLQTILKDPTLTKVTSLLMNTFYYDDSVGSKLINEITSKPITSEGMHDILTEYSAIIGREAIARPETQSYGIELLQFLSSTVSPDNPFFGLRNGIQELIASKGFKLPLNEEQIKAIQALYDVYTNPDASDTDTKKAIENFDRLFGTSPEDHTRLQTDFHENCDNLPEEDANILAPDLERANKAAQRNQRVFASMGSAWQSAADAAGKLVTVTNNILERMVTANSAQNADNAPSVAVLGQPTIYSVGGGGIYTRYGVFGRHLLAA
jgi:hypothetical protein